MGPTPSSDDHDHDRDRDRDHGHGHGRDACGVPLRAVTALTAVAKVVTPSVVATVVPTALTHQNSAIVLLSASSGRLNLYSQEGRALGARAMACMSRKEIPRCLASSQRTIRTHLTLSNRVRRPMAASCG